jgi:hypothetical protein
MSELRQVTGRGPVRECLSEALASTRLLPHRASHRPCRLLSLRNRARARSARVRAHPCAFMTCLSTALPAPDPDMTDACRLNAAPHFPAGCGEPQLTARRPSFGMDGDEGQGMIFNFLFPVAYEPNVSAQKQHGMLPHYGACR